MALERVYLRRSEEGGLGGTRSRRVAAFAILFAALLLRGTARASGADWDDDDDDFDSPPAARMREARAERESAERARAPSDAAALRAARGTEGRACGHMP